MLDANAVLDELTSSPPAPLARSGTPRLGKVRYTHEDCINRILAEPTISQNTLAELYGYTPGWMSIIVNSDAFQARLAERRAELVDPILQVTINERFKALTIRSLEVLQEKLAKPADFVPDKLALEAAALGARSLGIGQAQTAPPPGSAADHLASLAHRLLDLQGAKRPAAGEVIDV